jgi:hypothetical protein
MILTNSVIIPMNMALIAVGVVLLADMAKVNVTTAGVVVAPVGGLGNGMLSGEHWMCYL